MRITILIVVAVIAATSLSCSILQSKGSVPRGTDQDPASHIVGTWKLEAVSCDADGNNCRWYGKNRVFSFSTNGDVSVDGKRRGTYRIDGRTCRISTGIKDYLVIIKQVDDTRLITGEPQRSTTEIFRRIK